MLGHKLDNDSVLIKLHQYASCLLFFALPFPDRYLPMALGIWVLSWLILRIWGNAEKLSLSSDKKKALWIFVAWLLLGFISILFTDDPYENSKLIERRLTFVIIPLVLLVGESVSLNKKQMVWWYLAGSMASLGLYFYNVTWQYFIVNEGDLRFNLSFQYISSLVSDYKHPAYLSLNLVLALFLSSFNIDFSRVKNKLITVLILIITGVSIAVIQSRAGMISFSLLTVYLLWRLFENNKVWRLVLPVLFALSFFFSFSVILQENQDYSIGADERELLWQSSVELILEKPYFGYGLGGGEEPLIEQTFKNGFLDAKNRHLNAHNQFLQSLLDNGILGTVLLFLSLFFLFRSQENKLKFIGAVLFFALAFFFESMLQRIAGVMTFGVVFYFFFLKEAYTLERKTRVPQNINYFLLFSYVSILLAFITNRYDSTRKVDSADASSYAINNYELIKYSELKQACPIEFASLQPTIVKYDNSVTGWTREGNVFRHVPILKEQVSEGDTIIFQAYCYMSVDCDATWVRISLDGDNAGKDATFYNLENIGEWQNLSLKTICSEGEIVLSLMFSKFENESFDDMKGSVMFTLPEYEILPKN